MTNKCKARLYMLRDTKKIMTKVRINLSGKTVVCKDYDTLKILIDCYVN